MAGVLVVFSLVLRLALISRGPYTVDVLLLHEAARRTLETGHWHGMPGPGYPLTVLSACVTEIFADAFSWDPIRALNGMSAVYGALAVGAFFLWARRLLGGGVAFFGAWVFSWTPLFLGLSTYAKSHTPALFFLLSGMAVIAWAPHRPEARWRPFHAGLLLGLAGAARLQEMGLTLPAAAYAAACIPGDPRTRSRRTVQVLLTALGTAALFHLPFIWRGVGAYGEQFRGFWHAGIVQGLGGGYRFRGGLLARQWIASLSLWGTAASLAGWAILRRRHREIFWTTAIWSGIPLLFYAGHRYLIDPRFLAPAIPAAALASGTALHGLWMWRGGGRLRGGLLLVLYGVLVAGPVYPLLLFRHTHAVLPGFVRWVAARTEPRARVITADERPFLTFYTDRRPLSRPTDLIRMDPADLDRFGRRLDGLLDKGVPVYITTAGLFAYDRDRQFSSFMKARYEGAWRGTGLFEDWHRGVLTPQFFPCDLYRLRRKSADDEIDNRERRR